MNYYKEAGGFLLGLPCFAGSQPLRQSVLGPGAACGMGLSRLEPEGEYIHHVARTCRRLAVGEMVSEGEWRPRQHMTSSGTWGEVLLRRAAC